MISHKKILLVITISALITSIVAPCISIISVSQAQVIKREEMLVIGGAYWEMPPKKWNVFSYGASCSGIVGLIYEPLYIWVPIKPEGQRFIPWLAADLPRWIDPTTVEIKIRPEAKWWDGKPVTAEDVQFSYYYVPNKVTGAAWAGMRNYISNIEVVDQKTVRIKFTEDATYGDFLFQLYSAPILPKHILQSYVDQYGESLTNVDEWPAVAEGKDQKRIIASGMYKVIEIGSDYFMLERVDTWWGKDVKASPFTGSLPAPKYIKGVVVYSNQVAANMIGAGQLDWSNFFIPGGPNMVERGLAVAYYKNPPYYLSANVAFLFVNTEKEPFKDAKFRRAIYYAINVDNIIASAFEGAVLKSNPVGLLPYWEKYLAKDLIEQYGYKYDPDRAIELLDKAGYKDCNNDGWRDTPDCKPIRISIIVPYGWTDWMFAIINIAQDLRKVGIYAEATFPDFGAYASQIDKGEYDAAINNFGSFAAPSPYSLLYWAYRRQPPGIWVGNLGRYNNENLNRLIDELGRTHPDNEAKITQLMKEIQKILLDEMPALPLWYNGYWFLASTAYWEGWPSENNAYGVPIIWNGQWQHGGLLVLLNLRPKGVPPTTPTTPPTTPTTPTTPPTTPTAISTVTVTVPVTTTVTMTAAAATVTATVTTTMAAATVTATVTTTMAAATVTTSMVTTSMVTTETVTETVTPLNVVIPVIIIVAIICIVVTYFVVSRRK